MAKYKRDAQHGYPQNVRTEAYANITIYGAKLDYIGDKGTDIFKSGWYDMCGGKVDYTVQAHNYKMGCDQYITGVAVGTSNPNYS